MKKLKLSVIALSLALNSFSQTNDTTYTMLMKKVVLEFDYKTTSILSYQEVNGKVTLNVAKNEVKCVHLADEKYRVRKVIFEYANGKYVKKILDSKDNIYFSEEGPLKITIGPARLMILL
jgi:hypothetical protein